MSQRNVTGCSTFPLEMCSHRWLENTIVCERVLLLLAKLKQHVAAVAAGTCAKLQNCSFEVIRESCMDNLLTAKLHFFLSGAKQIEPFLVMFQTDKLMVPFLSRYLFKLVKSLMERFVKSALLKLVTSAAKLPVISIDISKLYCGLF